MLLTIDDFEKAEDEREFMRAIVTRLVPEAETTDLISDAMRRWIYLNDCASLDPASNPKDAKHD